MTTDTDTLVALETAERVLAHCGLIAAEEQALIRAALAKMGE